MTGLLIVAHGSRREESNDEVKRLADRVRTNVGSSGPIIAYAFLEASPPSVAEAIEAVVRDGASRLFVLPYFLAAGNHVERDLPELVRATRRRYPEVSMQILPHLGAEPGLPDLLAAMIPAAPDEEGTR